MIYSKEKDFLFIHVPKTAGTSMKEVLGPYGGSSGLLNFVARRLEKFPKVCNSLGLNAKRTYNPHTTYRKIRRILPAERLDNIFVFAFVRHPYDRLYSFYHHILAHPEHPWYEKIDNYGTFKTMLRHLDEVQEPTQKSYLVDKNGNIKANFIGRFEQINTDFKKVCERLEIPGDLPKKNSREHKKWENVFTDEDKKYAFDFYEEDFEAFGYDPYF
ncbi:MAG TPA: sulfotransferase family 2 domain-containing protein [Balneolaceae bacterium]|nr:sulfotransferase family 2 domain-containing protein [Balneolaceae bacterium]